MIEIKQLDEQGFANWNAFIERNDDASFFHRAEWQHVLQRAFGHTPYYLFAERDGELCGVLPLFHVKTLLFGNSLISIPFCVYGGAVADDESVHRELVEKSCQLAKRLNVDYLELRNAERPESDWPGKELYVRFRKVISREADENLKAIPRKQRAMVRKGIKAGLDSQLDSSVETFYACYSESVRNLGTPVFSKKYFTILKEVFADDCEILIVTKDSAPVAGVMSFYFKNQVLPYYGGGKVAARNLYANDFMYWQVMERARAKGIEIFDYGRSKVGSGSYRFKKHWGFEPEPLAYCYYLVKSKQVPNISPNNARYKYFVDAWRKLPLSVSNRVGPWLAKQLG